MIVLTRLNGSPFAINPDIVQRVEATPDTVVTLVDGARFLVSDPVDAVVAAVRTWRASVIAAAADPALLHAPACSRCEARDASPVAVAASGGRDPRGDQTTARPSDRQDRTGLGPVVPIRRRRP